MLKFGIAPRVLEAKLDRKVYNFALLDGKPALTYLLFRRAIAAGARPSAADRRLCPGGAESAAVAPADQSPLECAAGEPARGVGAGRELSRPRVLRPPGRGAGAAVVPLPGPDPRPTLLAALQGRSGPNPANNRPLRRNWQVNGGGILLAKQPGFHGDVPPQWAGDLLSPDIGVRPENARYVRRLFRLAAEYNIAVYWLLPPNASGVIAARDGNGVHARYDRFVRGLLDQFPNLAVIDARHAGYEDTVFVDPVHLDRDGAAALSGDVAEVLENALSHSEPVARWVELPAYRRRAGCGAARRCRPIARGTAAKR